MTVIKWIATIGQLAWLIAVFIDLGRHGQASGFWLQMAALLTLTVVITLIAVWGRQRGDSWFGLYFKRKRLEESNRIKELEGKGSV